MSRIAIIDYQMGNLRSVQKGFEKVGHAGDDHQRSGRAGRGRKVVLPGVGAFGDAMAELETPRAGAADSRAIDSGKPFLGICLGLQLLFDVGYEGAGSKGWACSPARSCGSSCRRR